MTERSMYSRMVGGEPYLADDPEIIDRLARAQRLCRRINALDASEAEELDALFQALLGRFGEGAVIRPPFRCDYGSHIEVGARTFINFGLVVLDVARVTIGDDVNIGPSVQLLTATHPLDPELRRAKWESGDPISIGSNAWIGGGVIVCPGVAIGADTVVGAGAVVTKDLPAAVLAVGNPARVIREL